MFPEFLKQRQGMKIQHDLQSECILCNRSSVACFGVSVKASERQQAVEKE